MNNNFYLTIYSSIVLMVLSLLLLDFSFIGFMCGWLYGQIIEWFVHGWIQHHPFKIFKSYRDNHTYHHKHPNEPLSVQPISYFFLGSVLLLLPFYWFAGFIFGYFFVYTFINTVHYDLHSEDKLLPDYIWDTKYFKWLKFRHEAHHVGTRLKYTTHSVTNPFLDILFSKVRLTRMNNWIARRLKI